MDALTNFNNIRADLISDADNGLYEVWVVKNISYLSFDSSCSSLKGNEDAQIRNEKHPLISWFK